MSDIFDDIAPSAPATPKDIFDEVADAAPAQQPYQWSQTESPVLAAPRSPEELAYRTQRDKAATEEQFAKTFWEGEAAKAKTPDAAKQVARRIERFYEPPLPVENVVESGAKAVGAPFAVAGRIAAGAATDIATNIKNRADIADPKFTIENLRAALTTSPWEPLPIETQLAHETGVKAGIKKGLLGAAKLGGELATLPLAGPLRIPAAVAVPGVFGASTYSQTGDVKAAAMSAALGVAFPLVDRVAAEFAGNTTAKLLRAGKVTETQAKVLEVGMKAAAMQATMQALAIPQYMETPGKWPEIFAENATMGLVFHVNDAIKSAGVRPLGRDVTEKEFRKYVTGVSAGLRDIIQKGAPNAEGVRTYPGQLPTGGQAVEGSEAPGGNDLQQSAPGQPQPLGPREETQAPPAGENQPEVKRPVFIEGGGAGPIAPEHAAIAKETGLKAEPSWEMAGTILDAYSLPNAKNPFTIYVNRGASAEYVLAKMRAKVSQEIEGGKLDREDVPLNLRPPTPAQAEAGNFPKRRTKWQGFNIRVENEKGSIRSGEDAEGNKWSVPMLADYGYVEKVPGAESKRGQKDKLDIYLGPNPEAPNVWVIDQIDPKTGKFDEHKVMAGFDSPLTAMRTYDAAFSDGSGPARRGAFTTMSVEEFKKWTEGDTTKAVAYKKPEDTAKKIENLKLTIAEAQDLQHWMKEGHTFEDALEMVLSVSGRTTSPVNPQMVAGEIKVNQPKPEATTERTTADMTKEELARELAGPEPSYLEGRLKNRDEIKMWLRRSKSELAEKVDGDREAKAKQKVIQDATTRTIPEVQKIADDAGTSWRTALRDFAKKEGANYNPPKEITKGEAVYTVANSVASIRLKKPTQSEPGDGPGGKPTEPIDPNAPTEKQTQDLWEQYGEGYDRAMEEVYQNIGESVSTDPHERVSAEQVAKDRGEILTTQEAKARVDEWKAAAEKESDRKNQNSDKIILSLFDSTGVWSQPWRDAGYTVVQIDKNIIAGGGHEVDVMEIDAEWLIDNGLDLVHGILAACPCTEFAGSGAKWFAIKDADGRTAAAKKLVHQTLAIIEWLKPDGFWAIENPVGRLKQETDIPLEALQFQPHNYGDPYTKRTQIYGDFNPHLPQANVEPSGGSYAHNLRGDAPESKDARSTTFEGFAYSFFMANKDRNAESKARDILEPQNKKPPEKQPPPAPEKIAGPTKIWEWKKSASVTTGGKGYFYVAKNKEGKNIGSVVWDRDSKKWVQKTPDGAIIGKGFGDYKEAQRTFQALLDQPPAADTFPRMLEIEKEFGLDAKDAHFFNVAIDAVDANRSKWTSLAEGIQKEALRAAVAANANLTKVGDLKLAKQIAEKYLGEKTPTAKGTAEGLTPRETELLRAIQNWKRPAGEFAPLYPDAEAIGATPKEWSALTKRGWMDKGWPGVLSMKARMALDNPFEKKPETKPIKASELSPAERSTAEGQKKMASEAATVATVTILNRKVREKSPSEAWDDKQIQEATGNQTLLNSIRDDLLPIYNRLYATQPEPKLTPMMAEYQKIKGGLPKDALLMFRLGDFYEFFFDDAKTASEALKVALTNRNGVPMAGIPFHAAEGYINKLLKAGHRVAIADQTGEAKPGELVKREVVDIKEPRDSTISEEAEAEELRQIQKDKGKLGRLSQERLDELDVAISKKKPRKTPATGTPERTAMDEEWSKTNDELSEKYRAQAKLKDEMEKVGSHTKAYDKISARFQKASAAYYELQQASEPLRERVKAAHLEDRLQSVNPIEVAKAASDLGDREAYKRAERQFVAEAVRQGFSESDAARMFMDEWSFTIREEKPLGEIVKRRGDMLNSDKHAQEFKEKVKKLANLTSPEIRNAELKAENDRYRPEVLDAELERLTALSKARTAEQDAIIKKKADAETQRKQELAKEISETPPDKWLDLVREKAGSRYAQKHAAQSELDRMPAKERADYQIYKFKSLDKSSWVVWLTEPAARRRAKALLSKETETPAKAVAEVVKEVGHVAAQGLDRKAKQVKADYLRLLEDEISKLVKESDLVVEPRGDTGVDFIAKNREGPIVDSAWGTIEKAGDKWKLTAQNGRQKPQTVTVESEEQAKWYLKALAASGQGKVKIHIPGDGETTIWRMGDTMLEVWRRVRSLDTRENVPTAKLPSGRTPKTDDIIKAYGGPEAAYRTAVRQARVLEGEEKESAQEFADEIYKKTNAYSLEQWAERHRDQVSSAKADAAKEQKEIDRINGLKKKTSRHERLLEEHAQRRDKANKNAEDLEKKAVEAEQTAAKAKAALEADPKNIVEKGVEKIEDLQKKLESGFHKGDNAFGVPTAVLNLALESARLTLKATNSVIKAVEAAIKYIREKYKGEWDEAEVRGRLEAMLDFEKEPPGETEGDGGENLPREQVLGVKQLGSPYIPQALEPTRQTIRNNYFNSRADLTPENTDRAFDIARQMADPDLADKLGVEVRDVVGQNADAALVLLRNELADYALRQAIKGDQGLMRFMVANWGKFASKIGNGTSASARELNALKNSNAYKSFSLAHEIMQGAYEAAGKTLKVDDKTLDELIKGIADLRVDPDSLDASAVAKQVETSEPERLTVDELISRFGAAVGLDSPTSKKLAELVEESARKGLQTKLEKVNESEAARVMEQLKASFPKLAGWRDFFTRKGSKALGDAFWKLMAGPREPEGHVSTFEKVVQSELSRLLRQAMADEGFEGAASPKLTTPEKIIQFLGKDPLRSDKLALIDKRVREDIATRPEEVAEQLTDLWDKVMGVMSDAPASNVMSRRIVQETLRELKPDWAKVLTDPAEEKDLRARVLSEIEKKLRRAENQREPDELGGRPEPMDLTDFRNLAGVMFDNVVAVRRNRKAASKSLRERLGSGRTLSERQAQAELDRLERDYTEWLKPEGRKNQVREIMREFIKPKPNTRIPTGKAEFVNEFANRLREIGADYETGRRLGEEVWNRKQALDATARQRARETEERKLIGAAEVEAKRIANKYELTEFAGDKRKRGIVEQTLKEFFTRKIPFSEKTGEIEVSDALNYGPLREKLIEVGVSPATAERLAFAANMKRQENWQNARLKAMSNAATRGSLRPLIERIQESPHRAQTDPAWRLKTAEDWFKSNGLDPEQAKTAARDFNKEFEAKMLEAGEELARRVLRSRDDPATMNDIIRGIRSGLLDPNRSWADDIAARSGWKSFSESDFNKLADLEVKASDEALSPQEKAAIEEQMMSVLRHHAPADGAIQRRINEGFVASLLSGIRTLTVQFGPVMMAVRDFGTAAIAEPKNIPALADAIWQAARNVFAAELKYAWQKDAYGYHLEAIDRQHKELKRWNENLDKEYAGTSNIGRKAWVLTRKVYALQQFVSRTLSTLDQAMMATTREWKLAYYTSHALKEAGLTTRNISEVVDAIAVARRTEYERALADTGDPLTAKVRANYRVGEAVRDFVANKTGKDSYAHNVLKAAENDIYSMVGRRAEGLKETEEGFLSRPILPFLQKLSEIRGQGGFPSLLAVATTGFVNVPFRTMRFFSSYHPYGLLRYGIYRYRTNRGLDNYWKQTFANELMARQRLREAIAGTVAMLVGTAWGAFYSTADDKAGKDKFGLYITGAGPQNKNLRDGWMKQGWRPYALNFVIGGHKVAIPLTRVGEAIMFPFMIPASLDDAAWKRKEIAAAGRTPPGVISSTAASLIGTHFYMTGQKGIFQTMTKFGEAMQGGQGVLKAATKLAAGTLSAAVLPFKQTLASISDMFVGPIDQSSVSSIIAANFPIVGLPFQKPAVNSLGDELYDRSWYGRLSNTGIPIAFQVSTQRPNQELYNLMVNKGAGPPELRRFLLEEKYGPLTDDQFSNFAKATGRELKQRLAENISDLRTMDPNDVKKFMAASSTQAKAEAADRLNFEPVKEPALTTAAAPAPRRASSRMSRTRKVRSTRLRSSRLRTVGPRRSSGRSLFASSRRSALRKPSYRRARISLA